MVNPFIKFNGDALMFVFMKLFFDENRLIFGFDDAHKLLYLIKSSFFYFLLVKLGEIV